MEVAGGSELIGWSATAASGSSRRWGASLTTMTKRGRLLGERAERSLAWQAAQRRLWPVPAITPGRSASSCVALTAASCPEG